jgi:hypothetical protein
MAERCNKVAVSPAPRQVGNGWVLDAVFADGKAKTIKGFRTESEASEWAGSTRHVMWLRDNRVGPRARAVLAAFGYLRLLALVLAFAASALVESARQTWSSVKRSGLASRAVHATLTHVNASAPGLASVASGLPEQVSDLWSAAKPMVSTFCLRGAHRRRLVVTAALLTVGVVAMNLGSTERPDGSAALATPQVGEGMPRQQSQPIEPAGVSDPIALLIGRLSDAAAEPPVANPEPAEPPVSRPVRPDEIEGEIRMTPPPHDLRMPNRPVIAGVWVPEPGSCSGRNSRERILPAVISTHGARAGDTSCVFKNQKQTERDWRMLASCSNPHENWTTNVRLIVRGDRLIWTSKRGIQTYTRCRPDV